MTALSTCDSKLLATLEAFHNVGFWSFDRQTRQLKISDRAAAFLGNYETSNSFGFHRFLKVIDSRDRAQLRRKFLGSLRDGTPFLKTVRLQPVNGKRRSVRLSVESESVDGRIVAIWGLIEDVTAQRNTSRVAKEAQRNEARLVNAIKAMDEGFALYDENDRLLLCNDQYRNLYRESAPAIVEGAQFSDILRYGLAKGQYPDAIGLEDKWLSDFLSTVRQAPRSFVQKLPNGRWLRGNDVITADGSRAGFRVDITAMKSLERKLALALLEARSAGQLQSSLLPNLAHEMRTPLNAIIGFSQLVPMTIHSENAEEKIREYSIDIEQSGRLLLAMIDNFLDLSEIGLTSSPSDDGVTKLNTALEQAERVLAFHLRKSNKKLIRTGSAGKTKVLGNHTKMVQIMLNLLSNALKYSGSGGIIELSVNDTDRRFVTVWVIDDGPGIPEETRDNLFQRYERLTADTTSIPGSGLGLAIAREFIEAMGGKIGVETAQNGGAAFWVAFKREKILPHKATELRLRA